MGQENIDGDVLYKYFVPTGLGATHQLTLLRKDTPNEETIPLPAGPNTFIDHDHHCDPSADTRTDPRRSADNQIRRWNPDLAGWKNDRVHGRLGRLQTGCLHHPDLAGRQRVGKELSTNSRRQIFDEPAL